MTREDVLSADLATLRLLVAEHVMGHATPFDQHPVPCPDGRPGCCVLHYDTFDAAGVRLPAYSTDVAAGMAVLEKVEAEYAQLCVEGGEWECCITLNARGGPYVCTPVGHKTAAEAICRASLLATLEAKK